MKLEPVASTNVQAVGYDPAAKTMHVQFRGGATYAHHGVTAAQHADFMAAKSKGQHYHAHFKDKHSPKRVDK